MAYATFCTWNLKTLGGKRLAGVPLPAERLEVVRSLLEARGPTILALQEVTPGYAETLAPLGLRHSLAYRPPGPFDGGIRMLGVGLLASGDVDVRNVGVVERAPFPERTLTADVTFEGHAVHVLAFHSLTGVGFRAAKHAQFRALAEYLTKQKGPTLFLGDANEPRVDARDPERIACWHRNGDDGEGAALLFGPKPVHGLVDAYRKGLDHDALASCPEDGPLAISHVASGRPCRYDFIYVPPSWTISSVSYDMQRATEAGSDHAIVTARASLP